MSTIALVLFFLMLLAYIQNIITGQNLVASRLAIEEAEEELNAIKAQRALILADLEQGKQELALSEKEIENQRKIIAASNAELGTLRTKLQQVAVLRLDILQKVKESIEKEMGKTNDEGKELVTIGENANIIINESLVFDYNSYTVKDEGKELLKQLSVAFEKVLDDDNVRYSIDAVNIEGHTDSVGDTQYNRELSTKRSTTVVNYLMQSNPSLEDKYGQYFAASGYSEFRPITTEHSEKDRKMNRRIEISIIIKDSSVQKIIEDYLTEAEKVEVEE